MHFDPSFVSECFLCKQTHFIIMMKTKNMHSSVPLTVKVHGVRQVGFGSGQLVEASHEWGMISL